MLPADVALPMVPVLGSPPEARVVSAVDTDALTMALATAMPGDVIELEPGVAYRSAYVVSRGNVTLRTRGIEDVAMPMRIRPADAPFLARIVTGGTLSSLTIDASNVRVRASRSRPMRPMRPRSCAPGWAARTSCSIACTCTAARSATCARASRSMGRTPSCGAATPPAEAACVPWRSGPETSRPQAAHA
jgi:hypothetical protein